MSALKARGRCERGRHSHPCRPPARVLAALRRRHVIPVGLAGLDKGERKPDIIGVVLYSNAYGFSSWRV